MESEKDVRAEGLRAEREKWLPKSPCCGLPMESEEFGPDRCPCGAVFQDLGEFAPDVQEARNVISRKPWRVA